MELETRALAELDVDALVADAAALVQAPSVTGDERAAAEGFVSLARARGLDPRLVAHDLDALRGDPGHPGEEAARTELVGCQVVLPGTVPGAPRLCIDGHLDVVDPGTKSWTSDPWSGAVRDGLLHGRGAVDMKGAVAAALHAVAAVAGAGGGRGDVVLWAVSSEEDGGLGTFAALRDDAEFAGCVIPEPTGFDVACAQAGALTFAGVIPGVAAHAAARLGGVSAIDRYVPVHAALAQLERELNADVAHPLMREHELPYPISVGRVEAGSWSSSVPDRLVFEGRVGVPVGSDPADIRARVEEVVRAACDDAEVRW
ncbi:MAG: M20/M25/M40 family metallo-hydrolase, partial [Thermoleophilaceae bacterium]